MLIAEQFLRRQLDRSAGEPFSAGDGDDIGQVELALGVVAVERIEEFGQATCLDHHDAAIDETDRLLLRAGVGRLDDTLEPAVGRQHEAAVGAGVGGTHTRDKDCCRGAAPLRQQPRQCLGGEKRRIAVEHEHILDRALRRQAAIERPHCRPHRIAGAERRILHDAFGRSDDRGDLFHPRPDHDEGRGRGQRAQRLQRISDHRPPGDRMHHLRHSGFHPRAAAGGKNDCGK